MINVDNIIETVLLGKDDSDAHLMTLFGVAISLKAKNVLELGVRSGKSTLPLLKAVDLIGGKLTSVDIVKSNSVENKYRKNSNWQYIISDSLEYLKSLPTETKFDLIYLDDWHDGLHVLGEIELLSHHMTVSSIILLHDAMCWHTEPYYHLYPLENKGEFGNGGPYRALLELDSYEWEFATIPVSHGLTILRKKQYRI